MNEHTEQPPNPPVTAIATVAPDGEIIEDPKAPPTMSPAQAKNVAVSNLMSKSVERASELRLTPEETKALKAEFPDECFRGGAAGKENLIYIEGLHLRNRLDEVLGIGQWSLVPRSRWTEDSGKGTIVYIEAMLIVRGCYITEAIGDMTYYPHNAQTNFGDAVEGAESACLRRCAKKMGVGLQAWSKTWCEGWWERKNFKKKPQAQQAPAQQQQQPAKQQAEPPPKKQGPTEAEVQQWLTAIRKDAQDGMAALGKVWNTLLDAEQKKALAPHKDALKKIALEADAKREEPART